MALQPTESTDTEDASSGARGADSGEVEINLLEEVSAISTCRDVLIMRATTLLGDVRIPPHPTHTYYPCARTRDHTASYCARVVPDALQSHGMKTMPLSSSF